MAEPRTAPLTGLIIAASGSIPGQKHEHIQQMAEEGGARFERLKIKDCTHMITTQRQLDSNAKKIEQAKALTGCEFVTIDWLTRSIHEKLVIDVEEFRLTASNSDKQPKKETSGGCTTRAKRKLEELGNDNTTIPKNAPSKDMNPPGIPNESAWQVYSDSQNGAWDVKLLKVSRTRVRNEYSLRAAPSRIFHIQLIVDGHSSAYLRSSQGISCQESEQFTGETQINLDTAKAAFDARLKEYCGLSWAELQDPLKVEDYILISPKDAESQRQKANLSVLNTFKKLPRGIDGIMNLMKKSHGRNSIEELLNLSCGYRLHIKKLPRQDLELAHIILEKLDAYLGLPSRSDAQDQLMINLRKCYQDITGLRWLPSSHVDESQWNEEERAILCLHFSLKTKDKLINHSPSFDQTMLSYHVYQLLGLKEMGLVTVKSEEYELLAGYFNRTRGLMQDSCVLHIFRIDRRGEAEQFAQWRKENETLVGERRLLWHGSPLRNFFSILIQGLQAPRHRGAYFADYAGKSVDYCRDHRGKEALMLLCEVEIGHYQTQFTPSNYCSYPISNLVPGQNPHQSWRDANSVHPGLEGVMMPDFQQSQTESRPYHTANTPYDSVQQQAEYIVYNSAQIRQRYLFHIRI